MKIFLVGGAVRDYALGLEAKDKDYVVVGATPQEMLDAGYSQVGADFPVFLHPETGDEYALARTERKTGEGYLGFETDFNTDITLDDDLYRRDLTINSMAMIPGDDFIFAPHGGLQDINDKILRHTSDAFSEDPVRVLRIARFRARLGPEWTVADDTKRLIHDMAKKGVLNELTPERIWKELSRALMEDHPRLFFDTLLECDALHVVFPEVYQLKTALESNRWHPEGNAYEHTMLVLTQAAKPGMGLDLDGRYAALVHDFGKGITPRKDLPKHYGHDVKGVDIVNDFSNRLTVPHKICDVAKKVTRYHMSMHKLKELNPKTIVHMFDDMNVLHSAHAVHVLYLVGICDARGRLGHEDDDVKELALLLGYYNAYKSVKFADVFLDGETNPNKIKQGLFMARKNAVAKVDKNKYDFKEL